MNINTVGEGSALLSLVEIGVGSFLHAFRVPLSGQALSLNQGFILSRYALREKNDLFIPMRISTTASILKSLSPAGKKLTPMLAIAAQGLLFNFPVLVFGMNPIGLGLGMALLCLWAYIQPLLIYLLIYGKTFFDVFYFFKEKTLSFFPHAENALVIAMIALVTFKILIGWILVAIAYRAPEIYFDKYSRFFIKWGAKAKLKNKPSATSGYRNSLLLAAKDLLQPIFLISIILTAVFFIWSESSLNTIVWGILRPIAAAFVIFYLIRVFPVEKLFSANSSSPFVKSARHALIRLREF